MLRLRGQAPAYTTRLLILGLLPTAQIAFHRILRHSKLVKNLVPNDVTINAVERGCIDGQERDHYCAYKKKQTAHWATQTGA